MVRLSTQSEAITIHGAPSNIAFELAPNSNVFSGLALADLAMGADTYKSLLDQSLSVIPPTIAQRVISYVMSLIPTSCSSQFSLSE